MSPGIKNLSPRKRNTSPHNALINSSRNYNFPIKIALIISNNVNAKGLIFARKYSIPYKFFASSNRKTFESIIKLRLKEKEVTEEILNRVY